MKHNLYIRLVRFFYNLTDDLDEYRLDKLNKLGNVMFIFLFFTIWLTYILTAFGIDISHYTSLLMMIVPILAMGIRVQTLQLDRIEVEKKDLGTARWRMLKRSLWQTSMVVIVGILYSLASWNRNRTQGYDLPTTWQDFLISILPTIAIIAPIVLILFCISNHGRIKIIEEEE